MPEPVGSDQARPNGDIGRLTGKHLNGALNGPRNVRTRPALVGSVSTLQSYSRGLRAVFRGYTSDVSQCLITQDDRVPTVEICLPRQSRLRNTLALNQGRPT
jgi:hypothetical protein